MQAVAYNGACTVCHVMRPMVQHHLLCPVMIESLGKYNFGIMKVSNLLPKVNTPEKMTISQFYEKIVSASKKMF